MMGKIDRHVEELSKTLISLFPKFGREEQQIDLILYRLLARGKPVSEEQVSKTLQISKEAVKNYLKRITWVQRNDANEIIGFRGLTLKSTSHRLEVDTKTLYTWCALDTLFIPQLLGKTARVESKCPVTGNKIRLIVNEGEVSQLDPTEAVVSLVTPDAVEAQENVIVSFCYFVHFFSTLRAGEVWTSKNRGKTLISVSDAYYVGKKMNEAQYSEVRS